MDLVDGNPRVGLSSSPIEKGLLFAERPRGEIHPPEGLTIYARLI